MKMSRLEKSRGSWMRHRLLSWRMEQYMAESRNVLTSCIRLKSELQYDYFTELVLEAAKTSEKLTDKLRRLTLEVSVNPVQYENYKAELVTNPWNRGGVF